MKERTVEFAPEAVDDLVQLYDWIATAASPETAIGYIDRIEAHCRRMGLASERGHRRDDIRPGLRIVGFERRVTIAFTVSETRVTILRLFYGGRNWEALFEPEAGKLSER
ncbi:type II toxin-antitoxin system RelE/ParE family toxin [Roseobacter sp. HKCCA0434]|uniref:type II toxin-antitoxin system RelE/ParE family toxin n=1 Tax=Roseobacter sp. HKCCA0434 TaxID=3079297 RepID=UPI002905E5D4|nr:type II toxin-antitoxin system RelE/ParE family toxin [Roseobacter sp. HKCCA0434]